MDGKIAILTDTNSGITPDQAAWYGIYLVAMPVIIDDETYFENESIFQEEFFQRLREGACVSTSQPAPGMLMDCWDSLLEHYDEIIYLPMSSGLSGSCQTATILAEEYGGSVHVVDNHRISVTLRQSVLEAKHLAGQGKTAQEIVAYLEKDGLESSIYVAVNTLEYLKRSGRVTAAGAAIGTILNLKPVLQIQGEKLDAFAKVRGWKAAKKAMLNAVEKDLNERFAPVKDQMVLGMAYTCSKEEAQEWKGEILERFPGYELIEGPLSLSVACHIGPGAMAVTCMKKV